MIQPRGKAGAGPWRDQERMGRGKNVGAGAGEGVSASFAKMQRGWKYCDRDK